MQRSTKTVHTALLSSTRCAESPPEKAPVRGSVRWPTTGSFAQDGVPWPTTGFVVIRQILGKYGGPIPVGPTRWWEGVKTGEFPKPLKLGGRTVWRVSDINRLIEKFTA